MRISYEQAPWRVAMCEHREVAAEERTRPDAIVRRRWAGTRRWGRGGSNHREALLGIALVIEALVVVPAPSARAEAQTNVRLEYDVAPEVRGCPDAESFRATVRHQLGYDPFQHGSERHVSVTIAHRPTGFVGLIRWSEAGGRWAGERRIPSRRPDCSSIAAEVAFAVVVQLQLLGTLGGGDVKAPASDGLPVSPQPPRTPAPPTESGPDQPPRATPPPAPAPSDRDGVASEKTAPADITVKVPEAELPLQASPAARTSLSAGVGPSLALGISPRATGIGRLFVSGRRSWFSLELALDASLPVTQRDTDTSGFALERVSAATAACGHVSVLAGCLLGTLGVLRAHGVGVNEAAAPTGLFGQVGLRVAARFDLGRRFFVAVRGDGLVLLSPWTVTVNGAPRWVAPRAGALFGVDVGATFF